MGYDGFEDRGYHSRRPPQSFDELIERIEIYIRRFFNKKFSSRPPSHTRSFMLLVIGFAVIIALLTSFYTVDVSEEAVITRLGRYVYTTGSGLHFKLPFWIDRVTKVPSKVLLQEEFGFRTLVARAGRSEFETSRYKEESLMLTGDLNVADVEWIVQYRIADPWKYLFNIQDARRTLRDVTMSIVRRVVGDRVVGDVLTVGRVEIANEARNLIQEVLNKYDIGIFIEAIMLQDVNPPEPVKPAFNEVNEAKQEQEQVINNAEREYNKVIPEARGKAEQMIADAEAYAVNIVNRAKGEAEKFRQVLQEYRKAPLVTRKRLFIETMESIFNAVESFTIIDSKVKGVLPLYGALNFEKKGGEK